MYASEFRELVDELSNADHNELTRLAAGGGWRKSLMDMGKKWPESAFDLASVLKYLLASLVWSLPPYGNNFRRALVAQDILDTKATSW